MEKSSKIYVAGHRGLVGSAIVRALRQQGYDNLILRCSAELDLRNQVATDDFFATERPDYLFMAAAKVGGIYANDTYPADFIRDNLLIQSNCIDAAYRNGVKRLLFLGSSCIYPKLAPQPMPESCLLTGELEPTNDAYAIAKIAGIKMCQAYQKQYGFDAISAMPTNLYGPNDNFDLENSHVLPALIRKFHLAKLAQAGDIEAVMADESRYGPVPADIRDSLGMASNVPPKVMLWGSGTPCREFLHVDDMADASLFLMQLDSSQLTSHPSRLFNVGVGSDVTIRDLAELVQRIVGFDGEVIWDASKPDGTPRKLMDVSRIRKLGWQSQVGLEEGIRSVYSQYCQ
ncbi:GDP-L-fucose synthase [Mariprofundus sp. NF]|uniref:GDP-L-fucose synthase family protein n=1 Tax=Mariprofundus sp. NF TaxID=2608716 RepID=UPI0015A447B3|nr:GDP-L-fucose synthase [Mariprofundus sp. NF]NWF39480.1 GDP-L-fucose synthase [Mariprofundus sp. NF]